MTCMIEESLELGELADFDFKGWTRYRVVGNLSVDFALDTFVNDRICDHVDENGAMRKLKSGNMESCD